MVTRSLFTGVSGLQTHMQKMDVLSNNLSNINTPGFKKSNVTFQSFLSQSISAGSTPGNNKGGTNPQQVGLGVQMGSINLDMSQGQLQRTGINTDLAIQGEGFFQLQESGSGDKTLFCRAGSFQFDSSGKLVDPSTGNIVKGYVADKITGTTSQIVQTESPIKVTDAMKSITASATENMTITGNLNADGDIGIESTKVTFKPENSSSESEVRFDFKRYHPNENYYHFEAVWTKNPPTGKQIGSSVENELTGRKLEGIMELNDDGDVIGLYHNSDRLGMNGAARIEVNEGNQADFTVNKRELTIRNQTGIFSDFGDGAGQNPPKQPYQFRVRFVDDSAAGGPSQGFQIEWQDVNGNWNAFDGAEEKSVTDLMEDGYGYLSERDVYGGAGSRKGEIRIEAGFLSGVSPSEIEYGTTADPASVDMSDQTVGDQIYFQVHQGEASGDADQLLEQEGEEPKKKFKWGGRGDDPTFVTSKPETVSVGSAETPPSLNSVYNYEENFDNLSTSTAHNSLDNYEFDVYFSDANTYHVATNTGGNKGNTDGLDAGEAAGQTNIDVSNPNQFSVGDLIKFEDTSTGNEEVAIVDTVNAADIDIQSPTGGGLNNPYTDAGTTITNLGQALTTGNGTDVTSNCNNDTTGNDEYLSLANLDRFKSGDVIQNDVTGEKRKIAAVDPGSTLGPDNENVELDSATSSNWNGNNVTNLTREEGTYSFNKNDDETLWLDTEPGVDNDAGANENYTDAVQELGISIASNNFTNPDSLQANDHFRFQVSGARTTGEEKRPFAKIKDADDLTTPVFLPEGSNQEPVNILFEPDTAQIEADGPISGASGQTEKKSDEAVQVAASADAYDSEGQQYTLTMRFEKQDTKTWMWHAMDPTPIDKDQPRMAGFGKIEFTEDGTVKGNPLPLNSKVALHQSPLGPKGDAAKQKIFFNPPAEQLQNPESPEVTDGAAPIEIDPDFTNLTEFGGDSDAEISDQDGNAAGDLQSLKFDQTGTLNGSYDNGETVKLAQITLASFQNPGGLNKEGGTYFSKSANSGDPVRNTPGQGGTGTIAPGSLERSNVDLSAQFTQMISTQRGFQANTKTITTSDRMIQQVLRLR